MTLKTFVVTGYTSTIARELFDLTARKGLALRVLKCGRGAGADRAVDFASLDQALEFVAWLRGIKPDYLFLNHGLLPGKKLCDTPRETVAAALHVNLVSFAAVIEALPEFEGLRTVVMSSISGKAGSYDTLYAACKAGVDVVVKRVAGSLPPSSRLNAVSPGIIEDARMTTVRKDADVLAAKVRQTPTRKFTTSRDVAGLVHYLLFENDNVQGENINLNGGIYIS